MTYTREDFKPVPLVADAFYCPACNASNDDYNIPNCGKRVDGGVCGNHGTGRGSLNATGVEAYLVSVT